MAVASGEVVGRVERDITKGGLFIAADTPGDALYYVYQRDQFRLGQEKLVLATVPPALVGTKGPLMLGPTGPVPRLE